MSEKSYFGPCDCVSAQLECADTFRTVLSQESDFTADFADVETLEARFSGDNVILEAEGVKLTVRDTADGAVFSATDENGTTTAILRHGRDGVDGAQGPVGPTGPQGQRGPQGDTGPQGQKGDTGEVGPTGPTGPTGPQGPKGDTGPRGDKGDTGAQGPAGTIEIGSVTTGSTDAPASVSNSGTATAAVLDFVIPRGEKGDTGPRGDKGDTGATGPQGERGERGYRGDPGKDGKDGKDGTVTFDELTDAQKSQLTEGITDDLAESFQSDLATTVKITPSGMFSSYATMHSYDTFTVDTLKIFTVIEKNANVAGNYYGGHTFIGLYKDAKNSLSLWAMQYNVVLDNVVNGVNTRTTFTGMVNTINPSTDVCSVIDFVRNRLQVRGLINGEMTTFIDFDLNTLDLSALDSFKLMCGAGKYSGNQANIYARINDYFDYPSLMNQPLYMSNYNSLPVVSGEKVVYEATGLTLGGTITNTISATHKISNATMTTDNYFAMQSTNSTIGSKTNVNLVTRFKVTSMSADTTFGVGAGTSRATIIDEDGTFVWGGSGRFVPELDKWYYLTTTVSRDVNYGASYGMRAIGTFTIEAEALFIAPSSSINMCAETWNGKYFTGVLPFEGTGVVFTAMNSFSYHLTGKFVPVLAPYVHTDGAIYMYNGSRWVLLGS